MGTTNFNTVITSFDDQNQKWEARLAFCQVTAEKLLCRAGIRDLHSADDLAAKSVLAAWIAGIDSKVDTAKGTEQALLYTICRYAFLMFLRTRGRDRHRFMDAADLDWADHESVNEEPAIESDLVTPRRLLEAAIPLLPINERNAVQAHLSPQAKEMKTNRFRPGWAEVRQHLYRARKRLKAVLPPILELIYEEDVSERIRQELGKFSC